MNSWCSDDLILPKDIFSGKDFGTLYHGDFNVADNVSRSVNVLADPSDLAEVRQMPQDQSSRSNFVNKLDYLWPKMPEPPKRCCDEIVSLLRIKEARDQKVRLTTDQIVCEPEPKMEASLK